MQKMRSKGLPERKSASRLTVSVFFPAIMVIAKIDMWFLKRFSKSFCIHTTNVIWQQ